MSQRLTIIQGPAGTGKTTCVAAYVWNTVIKHPDSKVLVTAPLKSSLDQIVEYIVLAGRDKESRTNPVEAEEFGPEHCQYLIRPITLREQVKDPLNHTDTARKVAEGHIEPFRQRYLQARYEKRLRGECLDKLKALVKSIQEGNMSEDDLEMYNYLGGHVVSQATVVCCTLSGVGRIPFKDVVIDEATRALEPQALAAVRTAQMQKDMDMAAPSYTGWYTVPNPKSQCC